MTTLERSQQEAQEKGHPETEFRNTPGLKNVQCSHGGWLNMNAGQEVRIVREK